MSQVTFKRRGKMSEQENIHEEECDIREECPECETCTPPLSKFGVNGRNIPEYMISNILSDSESVIRFLHNVAEQISLYTDPLGSGKILANIDKSNLLFHAYREFELAGYFKESFNDDGSVDQLGREMNHMMANNVLGLIALFSSQGHSGMSASHCIDLFKTLASFSILTPLSGNDDEWNEADSNMYQNKRISSIFKNKCDDRNTGYFNIPPGVAYNISGIIFEDKAEGYHFGSSRSAIPVEFPYTPPKNKRIIKVSEDENGDYIYPDVLEEFVNHPLYIGKK